VVVDGPDLVYELAEHREYISNLYNLMKWYKKMNILSIRIIVETRPEIYNVFARFADIGIRFGKIEDESGTRLRAYLWKTGRDPVILSYEDVVECEKAIRREILKSLKGSELG
jgi:hypothetical protein